MALLDDVHRHRLRRAALHLPLPGQERGPFYYSYYSDRLLESGKMRSPLLHLKDGEEGLLRNFNFPDPLHPFFAFLLFFQQLSFSGDVSPVTFGQNVFAHGADYFAGDNFAADCSLDHDFKHLPGNQLLHLYGQRSSANDRRVLVDDQRKRVHRFSRHQDIQPDKPRFLVSAEMIIQRSIASRGRFHAVVKIEHDFVQRELIGNQHSVRGDVFEAFLNSALFFGELEDRARHTHRW